jgi:diguanylate cyclase (GGDEF)-like protein
MPKPPFNFLTGLEYCVYLLLILFVSTGSYDSAFSSISPVVPGITIALILVFICVIILLKQNDRILRNGRVLLVVSLLVIVGVHFSSDTKASSYPGSINHVFYYALVLLFSLSGSLRRFLEVYALFFISEVTRYIPPQISAVQSLNQMPWEVVRDQVLGIIPQNFLWHSIYIFGIGLIGYFFSWRHITYLSPLQKLIEKKSGPVIPPEMPAQNSTPKYTDGAKIDTSVTRLYVNDSSEQDAESVVGTEEELSSVVYFMSRMFNAYTASGFIYDLQKQAFVLNAYHSKSLSIIRNVQIPAQEGFFSSIFREKVSFISGNISDYGYALTYYSNPEAINSLLAVPILSAQNELLGALAVDSKDKTAFRDHHKEILNRFSHLAAALIINVRMRKYQERVAKQFQIFYESAQQFSKVYHTGQVLDILFRTIDQLTTYSRIIAVNFYSDTYQCVVRKVIALTNEIPEGFSFPLNDGEFSMVLKKRQTVIIDNYEEYRKDHFLFLPEEQLSPEIRSVILIPFITAENFCGGVISIEGTTASQFAGELGQLLITIVNNAAIAYQKAFLYEKMETLATTDGLTGLLNHRSFQTLLSEELTRSNRYKRSVSLLMMDIDNFKKFNDTYGHTTGDMVLREIAKCVRQTIRRNDIPARYGGEEFMVIIPETNPEGALIIGERVRQNIEALVIPVNNKELQVTVSIGLANVPEHTSDQQEMINFADIALYFSKENGKNQINIYTKKMGNKEKR